MKLLKKYVRTVKTALLGVTFSIGISVTLASVFTLIDDHTLFDDLCYGAPYRRIFYVIPGMLLAQIYTFHKQKVHCRVPSVIQSGVFEYLFIGFSMLWFFIRFTASSFLGYAVYAVDMIVVAGDLYALAVGKGAFSKLFSGRKMVYLGTISMYIFLSHYNIRMYVDFIIRILKIGSIPVAIIEMVIILVLTILLSVWIKSYRLRSYR